MSDYDLLVRAERAVLPDGERGADVAVKDGRIVAIEEPGSDLGERAAAVVELASDEVLLPGLVDSHVHVNDPGRTEWEGFASATRAAAAGGVTTIVDMPLNSIPPTVDVAALEVKRKAADGQCFVDVGSGAARCPATSPTCGRCTSAGVFGFKCFLLHSGVDEFPRAGAGRARGGDARDRRVRRAAHRARRGPARDRPRRERRRSRYADFLASRPRQAENLAIAHAHRAVPRRPAAGSTSCTSPAPTRCR